jgi:cysteinyl-tRNA synthetase
MSMKYLGESFDIHCGGVDHIPVHHTNEIAQSECATGHPFARFWMHGEFLLTNNAKLSKSTGGSINRLQALVEAGYDPIAYRYLCLQAHYRSELNFSLEALDAATAGLRKVYSVRPENDPFGENEAEYQEARCRVLDILNDDLGTPQAIGLLHAYNSRRLWLEFDAILGLGIEKRSQPQEETLPDAVLSLIEQRNAARKSKDWAQADALRHRLIEVGFEVGDGPQGTTVKKRLL